MCKKFFTATSGVGVKKAVIATTILASSNTPYERVRGACALKMLYFAAEHGYEVIVIDGGSPAWYVQAMKDLRGVHVYDQEVPGMGNARRQALRLAREHAEEGHAIVWTEPEKYPLITELEPAITKLTEEAHDLVMLRRLSLESYPPEQAKAYELIALATKYLTGIESDFGWGPTVLSSTAVEYYLNYESQHGDLWDGIHCPKLRIIKDGLRWTIVPVNYQHPPEQTAAETGMDLFLKRIKQVDQLVRAIEQEVDRLEMRVQ
jgi:hypothetical protein